MHFTAVSEPKLVAIGYGALSINLCQIESEDGALYGIVPKSITECTVSRIRRPIARTAGCESMSVCMQGHTEVSLIRLA